MSLWKRKISKPTRETESSLLGTSRLAASESYSKSMKWRTEKPELLRKLVKEHRSGETLACGARREKYGSHSALARRGRCDSV